MTTIFIILGTLGSLISIFSIAGYRYYSSLIQQASFDEAKKEREKISEKIDFYEVSKLSNNPISNLSAVIEFVDDFTVDDEVSYDIFFSIAKTFDAGAYNLQGLTLYQSIKNEDQNFLVKVQNELFIHTPSYNYESEIHEYYGKSEVQDKPGRGFLVFYVSLGDSPKQPFKSIKDLEGCNFNIGLDEKFYNNLKTIKIIANLERSKSQATVIKTYPIEKVEWVKVGQDLARLFHNRPFSNGDFFKTGNILIENVKPEVVTDKNFKTLFQFQMSIDSEFR